MSFVKTLSAAVSLPAEFKIDEVEPQLHPIVGNPVANNVGNGVLHPLPHAAAPPSLGALSAFVGNFTGHGFNTIFRPDSPTTPTPLPKPINGSDNVLELNLTDETLSFSASLGAVPNRGMVQGDIFLNGVPYLQSVSDVTTGSATGIHLEPGLWMAVPSTTDPAETPSLVRMASIPHGVTIVAQGTQSTIAGPPTIPPVDITPFVTGTNNKIPFPSQTAANNDTARIPQDLAPFITAGTITQAMLNDPNTLLRNAIAGQKIVSTTIIQISSSPTAPLFGGGVENIAFLLGNSAATKPNAQTALTKATFWIETVQHTIVVPPFRPGSPPLMLEPQAKVPGAPVPKFFVEPPFEITSPKTIVVTSTQIQYSQEVILNFNTLSWPHVSVATLVPAGTLSIPPSAWT